MQVRGRAVDGVDLRVRQHDVLQRLGLELDAIFRAAFGIGDHFLELFDRALIFAGVVIAPCQLVDGERIQLRQLEAGCLFECRPRTRQIVRLEKVLAHLHVRVGDESALRILLDQRVVILDRILLLPCFVQVVGDDEEHLVLALVVRIVLQNDLIKPERFFPIRVAGPGIHLGLFALALLHPSGICVVVILVLLQVYVARFLPPQFRQLEIEVGLPFAVGNLGNDRLQIGDQLVALLVRRSVTFDVIFRRRRLHVRRPLPLGRYILRRRLQLQRTRRHRWRREHEGQGYQRTAEARRARSFFCF